MQKNMLKKWSIWLSVGVVCFLAIFLITKPFQQSLDSELTKEVLSQTEVAPSVFSLRKISLERPLKTSNFNLSGILYDQQKPMAIINGRVVSEGALIGGAQLLEIQPNLVRLSLKDKEFTLKVK